MAKSVGLPCASTYVTHCVGRLLASIWWVDLREVLITEDEREVGACVE